MIDDNGQMIVVKNYQLSSINYHLSTQLNS